MKRNVLIFTDMRLARSISIVLLFWLASNPAYADSLSVTAQVMSETIPCDNSLSSSVGPLNVSCDGGIVTASASVGKVSAQAFSAPFESASASDMSNLSEWLEITGDTGTGTLTLDFIMNGYGGEIGNSLAMMDLFTNFGSIFPTVECDEDDCTWSATNAGETITIPFTFGTPFLFTEQFELEASTTEGASATAMGSIVQTGFSIVDSNQNPVSDAEILDVSPEPGTWGLMLSALALLAARSFSRR